MVLSGARGVLFPDVVLRRYWPVVLSAAIASCAFVFTSRSCVTVTWAKNAAFFQKSARTRFDRPVFTCSRCPSPLWQEMQRYGWPRKRWPVEAERLSYVSCTGPLFWMSRTQ